MIIIETRKELRIARREVKKLVEKALVRAKELGKVLSPGEWGYQDSNYRTVCLVGAIGCVGKQTDRLLYPQIVSPLIKNGASRWVHDDELIFLSDGFEKLPYYSLTTLLKREPEPDNPWTVADLGYLGFGLKLADRQKRWTEEYHQFLYNLGKEIREKYVG